MFCKLLHSSLIIPPSLSVVSILFLGAFLGSFAAVPCVKYRGHRFALAIAAVVFIAGAIAQIATKHSLAALYVGRVLAGVGIGR